MVAVMVACRTQDRLTDAGGDMTGFKHTHTHTYTGPPSVSRYAELLCCDLGQLIRKCASLYFIPL